MRALCLALVLAAACGDASTRKPMGTCNASLASAGANPAHPSFTGIFNSAQLEPSVPRFAAVCSSNDLTQQLQVVLVGQPIAPGASFPLGGYGSPGGWVVYLEDDEDGTHRAWTSTKGTVGVTAVDGATVTASFDMVPLSAPATPDAGNAAVGSLAVGGTLALKTTTQ